MTKPSPPQLPPDNLVFLPHRPANRGGYQATFYFEDGRRLYVQVPNAVALGNGGHVGGPACILCTREGVVLGEVKSFAALLARKTP